MPEFSISASALDCSTLNNAMHNDQAGAFVCFDGRVRNHNEGHSVEALEYEVFHSLAQSEGEKILQKALEKFKILDAQAIHREGLLNIGDCAIWIGVVAAHRGEAFTACRYIIDELKHRLPIWKKEHYTSKDPEWVNCQHCHHHAHSPQISSDDIYARQMLLPQIGADGQKKLSDARVLIIGAGGLGSSAALGLAGAGIGTIGVADQDDVSVSNLHRQILYAASDIGKPKAGLAAARLKALNPLIDVQVHAEKITADNVMNVIEGYDILIDCTDNFTSKYLLNDASVLSGKPLIQASIYQFEGQLLTFNPDAHQGCLRCLFPEPPEAGQVGDCATAGVLGTVPMLFGTLQANEAVKMILGLTTTGYYSFDLLNMRGQKMDLIRDAQCKICSDHASVKSLEPNLEITPVPHYTAEDYARDFILIDVREDEELIAEPLTWAQHFPFSAFDVTALAAIPKNKEILVICAHGMRSLSAVKALRQEGWTHAYSLPGGLAAIKPVKEAGLAA